LGLVTPGTERIHFIACMVAKCEGPEAKKSKNGTIVQRDSTTSYYDHGLEIHNQTLCSPCSPK